MSAPRRTRLRPWVAVGLLAVGVLGAAALSALDGARGQSPEAVARNWADAVDAGNLAESFHYVSPTRRDDHDWTYWDTARYAQLRCTSLGTYASAATIECQADVTPSPLFSSEGTHVFHALVDFSFERPQGSPWLLDFVYLSGTMPRPSPPRV